MWNGAAATCFKVLSRNMPGGVRNLQKFSVCLVRVTVGARTGTSLIEVRNFCLCTNFRISSNTEGWSLNRKSCVGWTGRVIVIDILEMFG